LFLKLQLVRPPDVVLIAQHNDVTRTQADGSFEVFRRAGIPV
jgi:hypothetical protein